MLRKLSLKYFFVFSLNTSILCLFWFNFSVKTFVFECKTYKISIKVTEAHRLFYSDRHCVASYCIFAYDSAKRMQDLCFDFVMIQKRKVTQNALRNILCYINFFRHFGIRVKKDSPPSHYEKVGNKKREELLQACHISPTTTKLKGNIIQKVHCESNRTNIKIHRNHY